MIKYYSTNKKSNLVSFKEALMKGQTPDNGLYIPNYISLFNLKLKKKATLLGCLNLSVLPMYLILRRSSDSYDILDLEDQSQDFLIS